MYPTVFVTQKVHGIESCVSLETVKKSVRTSIMISLVKHGGSVSWKDVHRSIIPGMKVAGLRNKFELVKFLNIPNIEVNDQEKVIYYAR